MCDTSSVSLHPLPGERASAFVPEGLVFLLDDESVMIAPEMCVAVLRDLTRRAPGPGPWDTTQGSYR